MSLPRSVQLPAGVRPQTWRPTNAPPPGQLATLRATPAGPAGRPVLLVPGFTGSKEDFLALLPLLAAAGHPAVALDLPGQYESPGAADPAAYTVEGLAVTVAALASDLAPDGAVHLVGHSFGGLVARAVVLSGRVRPGSLTLLGSGPAGLTGERAALLHQLRPVLDRGGLPALWAVSEELTANDPRMAALSDEVRAFLRRRFLASDPVGLLAMADALTSAPDQVAELAATGVALLVAWGVDDNGWPPAVQAEMARRLGAPGRPIPDAVHSPAVEAPAETARILVEFWAGVDEPAGQAQPTVTA